MPKHLVTNASTMIIGNIHSHQLEADVVVGKLFYFYLSYLMHDCAAIKSIFNNWLGACSLFFFSLNYMKIRVDFGSEPTGSHGKSIINANKNRNNNKVQIAIRTRVIMRTKWEKSTWVKNSLVLAPRNAHKNNRYQLKFNGLLRSTKCCVPSWLSSVFTFICLMSFPTN